MIILKRINFFGLLIHQRRSDRAVGSGAFAFRLLLLLALLKQLLCAFLYLIFLCGMMPFFVLVCCLCYGSVVVKVAGSIPDEVNF
jgi:hypothetical protein